MCEALWLLLETEVNVVLVCSGHYNRIPQTGQLINDRNLFLTSRGWKVQDKGTSMVTFWCRPSSWFIANAFLICRGGLGNSPGVSFIKALILFTRAPFSWPKNLPVAPPPNTSHWTLRFQHMNTGGTQPFRPKEILIPCPQIVYSLRRREIKDTIAVQQVSAMMDVSRVLKDPGEIHMVQVLKSKEESAWYGESGTDGSREPDSWYRAGHNHYYWNIKCGLEWSNRLNWRD